MLRRTQNLGPRSLSGRRLHAPLSQPSTCQADGTACTRSVRRDAAQHRAQGTWCSAPGAPSRASKYSGAMVEAATPRMRSIEVSNGCGSHIARPRRQPPMTAHVSTPRVDSLELSVAHGTCVGRGSGARLSSRRAPAAPGAHGFVLRLVRGYAGLAIRAQTPAHRRARRSAQALRQMP